MFTKIKNRLEGFWTIPRVIIAVVIIAVVIWIAMTIQVLNNNYKLQRQVDNAKLDNQVTELQNENLRLEQMYYKTDEYKDLQARSLLGKASPGEHMVILPRAKTPATVDTTTAVSETKSNIDQWLDFLFGQHN